MNNTLTAQIAAQYWGAKVIRDNELCDNVGELFFAQIFQHPHIISECQLIITPLEKISDEHAIEVAKILFKMNGDELGDNILFIKTRRNDLLELAYEDDGISLCIGFNCDFAFVDNSVIVCSDASDMALPVMNQVAAINYLRSKSYDCDNLISQGIAIDSTTL